MTFADKPHFQPRLRLRRDETVPDRRSGRSGGRDDEADGGERTLRFPTEALRSLPGHGWGRSGVDRRSGPERREAVRADDLARQIERTMDRVQSRFDDVKDQLDTAFRLIFPSPSPDDHRPSAA